MKYLNNFIIAIIIFGGLANCNNQKEKGVDFNTRIIKLVSDTTIQQIAYLNNFLLCLQDNGKIIVLDTAYKRQTHLEEKLNNVTYSYLATLNDTVFVGKEKKIYFLDTNFNQTQLDRLWLKTPKPYETKDFLYQDSLYYVSGCCAGEWGGSVFFFNKKTERVYSYPATCPAQVLRFKNEYIVCNYLEHIGLSMSFLAIKNPDKIYELKEDSLKNFCNWHITVDSIKEGYWNKKSDDNVRYYKSYDVMPLGTFSYQDSLYSILYTDSSTVLAVHRKDTVLTREILLDKPLRFHQSTKYPLKNKTVFLYRLTEGSAFAAYMRRGNQTGLVIIEGNMITILKK
jgi:hypothetical protein